MKHPMANSDGASLPESSLLSQVTTVIDEVRPLLRADGGDIELVSVSAKGLVKVRLLGACVGCPSSAITLTMGIERSVKEKIPSIQRVVCVP